MDGPLKGKRIVLELPVTRIGRREVNDWVLQDGSVSGTHCEIEMSDNGLTVRDLGSTNGTKVNNEPVKEKPLFCNDILLIGEVPIMVEGDDVPSATKSDPTSIPRTTIIIPQKRSLETPKVFVKKSNANRVWIVVIVLLLLVIAGLLYVFIKGSV